MTVHTNKSAFDARRKPTSGDDVVTGLSGNMLAQRLKLVSKVALVTGAAQGIGRAFAHALGEAGAAVAVVDVNADKAEATVAELREKGVRSIAIQADVTKAADCQRCGGSSVVCNASRKASVDRDMGLTTLSSGKNAPCASLSLDCCHVLA